MAMRKGVRCIRRERRAVLFMAVVLIAFAALCILGCSKSTPPDAERNEEAKASTSRPPVAQVRIDQSVPRNETSPAAPLPSDLRIDVVKADEPDFARSLVASNTTACFGWIDSPRSYSAETLFYYAAEKAVPYIDPDDRAGEAEAYIAGTVRGFIVPYDKFEVVGCDFARGTLAFMVKYVRRPDHSQMSLLPARAYYTIRLSALPPETEVMEIRFEQYWTWTDVRGGALIAAWDEQKVEDGNPRRWVEDIRVEIAAIRCENYFKPLVHEDDSLVTR